MGQGAPSPLQRNTEVETDVRIYDNGGMYAVPHASWSGSAATRGNEGVTQGGVATATRPETRTAALNVAVETQ